MLPRKPRDDRARLIRHQNAALRKAAVHAEGDLRLIAHRGQTDLLRDGIGHARAAGRCKRPSVRRSAVQNIFRRAASGLLGLGRDKIDQIVDVNDVAAGKNARDGRLHIFKYARAVGAAIHGNASAAGQLVFRDKPD